jgi:16S rRNA (guanine527-N7)-methyltransferase
MTQALRRLEELATKYSLPEGAAQRIDEILRLVANDETAPTTIRDPRAAADAHVADSLTGLEVEGLRTAQRIADLGAGAGFPGLVLAAALPDAQVSVVESQNKKCQFLERAMETAGLENVEVVNARAEEWSAGMGANDAITARAVAPLNVIAEYAAPLLRVGGTLVAWKGVRDPAEEADGVAAADELGLEVVDVHTVAPFRGADHHHLYVYSKVRDTPSRYPRRAGMARKRPLSTKS